MRDERETKPEIKEVLREDIIESEKVREGKTSKAFPCVCVRERERERER